MKLVVISLDDVLLLAYRSPRNATQRAAGRANGPLHTEHTDAHYWQWQPDVTKPYTTNYESGRDLHLYL